MKPVEPQILAAGIDGGDDDAPLGLVFPQTLEGDLGDVEGAAAPVGGGRHAATGETERGESQNERGYRQTERTESGGAGKTHGANIPGRGRETPGDVPGAGARRAAAPRLWWCNADFDLTLAHGGGKVPAPILAAARGMAWHMWPALAPGDALLVDAPPPPGFAEGLRAQGLAPPRFVTESVPPPDELAGALFTPFGWNDAAHACRNSLMQTGWSLAPVAAPAPDVVRRVNSRAFASGLERNLFGDDAGVFCADHRAIDRWLNEAPRGRHVAKGNHGHAGIGQHRFAVPAAGSFPADLARVLRRLAARHGGVLVEPERKVLNEWGVLFRLARDGRLSPLRVHRLLSDSAGGFAGALIDPGDDPVWRTVRDEARDAIVRIAAALHAAGYHGPVGIDMFLHEHYGIPKLRPLVDLNARQSMAYPAHGLAARFPGRVVLVRQFPATMLRARGILDDLGVMRYRDTLAFDSRARRGMIWLSPGLALSRHSFAFIGDSVADVFLMQDIFLVDASRCGKAVC